MDPELDVGELMEVVGMGAATVVVMITGVGVGCGQDLRGLRVRAQVNIQRVLLQSASKCAPLTRW